MSGLDFVHDETRPTYLCFDLYRSWVRSKVPPDIPIEARMIEAALGLMERTSYLIHVVRRSEPLDVPGILDVSGDIIYHAIGMMDSCSVSFPDPDVVRFERIAVADFRNQDILAVIQFGKAVGFVKDFVFHGCLLDEGLGAYVQQGMLAIHRLLITCGYRISTAMLNTIEKEDRIHLNSTRSRNGIIEGEDSRD